MVKFQIFCYKLVILLYKKSVIYTFHYCAYCVVRWEMHP